MITRSKELTVKGLIEVTANRHETGSSVSSTLTFRSANSSHQTTLHLTIEETTQLAEALHLIAYSGAAQ